MAFSTVGWCTSEAMETLGEQFGLPAANREKNKLIREAGLASIETARHAGVRLDYGTDLLGEAQPMQLRELVIRREVEPAADILRSMWEVSAELCGLAGFVGVLTPVRTATWWCRRSTRWRTSPGSPTTRRRSPTSCRAAG